MKKHFFYWLVLGLLVVMGCQKEQSFETGDKPGHGSLQSEATGDCLPKTVNGIYEVAKALVPGTNTITIAVDVTETGSYVITTDTVNGFYFRATGIFTTLGIINVTLRGFGTPFATGIQNFVVSFDGTVCDIQVTTLPAGAGGPAVYVLQTSGTGTPPNCSGATAAGTYIIGSPLNSSNTVTLSVNVTTIGTYTITSTATNGMTFSRSAAFLTTGPQTVVLVGSGTPTGAPGTITVPVTAGTITCSFQVTTVAGASFAFNCGSAVVNGTYTGGTPLDASNFVDIDVNVLTTGPYNISVTVNGMTFSNQGTFAATGNTNITLTGSGIPTNGGTFNVTMPGTPSCSFSVTCGAPPSIDWSFKQGTTTYSGQVDGTTLQTLGGGFTSLGYTGSNAAGETLLFSLLDLAGGINANETYNTSSTTNNNGAFIYNFPAGDIWTSAPGDGSSLIFKITVHNTATKTISGTFSGTVKNMAGTTLSITNGIFAGTYP